MPTRNPRLPPLIRIFSHARIDCSIYTGIGFFKPNGDRKVSTKELARQIGAKRVAPCEPGDAMRHSGYQVGGCSPFGLKKPMPVYMEESILACEKILINGGKRGFLVGMSPQDIVRVVDPTLVNAALIE